MSRSYKESVLAQSQRNPCLSNLCRFLGKNNPRTIQNCRMVSLEFSSADGLPRAVNLDLGDLRTFLTESNSNVSGKLLVVEDPTQDVIELLGSSGLNIDPLFFANYIHGPSVDIGSSRPDTAMLPSKTKTQNFITVQYHRVIEFQKQPSIPKKILRETNVPRKVVTLPPIKDKDLALVQHICSLLLTQTISKTWLGIVLVDAPLKNPLKLEGDITLIGSKLFQGGFEDFIGHTSYGRDEPPRLQRLSLVDDLIRYWNIEHPPTFNPVNPTLLSLAYYPLRIIAAEWVTYVETMSHSVKTYEYSIGGPADLRSLSKLDSDLSSLQVWGRRCMQTTHKLNTILRFLRTSCMGYSAGPAMGPYSLLIEDYEYLCVMVNMYGRRLENMVPVVTSVVQVVDTRRSLRETENVTRLTHLALLFVPLSFVTGLFSINDGVSGRALALYFAVAIPLCTAVFLFASLPFVNLKEFARKFNQRKRPSRMNV